MTAEFLFPPTARVRSRKALQPTAPIFFPTRSLRDIYRHFEYLILLLLFFFFFYPTGFHFIYFFVLSALLPSWLLRHVGSQFARNPTRTPSRDRSLRYPWCQPRCKIRDDQICIQKASAEASSWYFLTHSSWHAQWKKETNNPQTKPQLNPKTKRTKNSNRSPLHTLSSLTNAVVSDSTWPVARPKPSTKMKTLTGWTFTASSSRPRLMWMC